MNFWRSVLWTTLNRTHTLGCILDLFYFIFCIVDFFIHKILLKWWQQVQFLYTFIFIVSFVDLVLWISELNNEQSQSKWAPSSGYSSSLQFDVLKRKLAFWFIRNYFFKICKGERRVSLTYAGILNFPLLVTVWIWGRCCLNNRKCLYITKILVTSGHRINLLSLLVCKVVLISVGFFFCIRPPGLGLPKMFETFY